MYKSERLELRLTAREVQMIDEQRGRLTRSAYIRELIRRNQPTPHTHSTSGGPVVERVIVEDVYLAGRSEGLRKATQ